MPTLTSADTDMSATNLFFLKTLLLLWVVCVVVCEYSKRDVRRIIIKDRPSRSPKKNHHSHGHSHRGRGRSRGRDHKYSHKSKGKKHKHSSEEEGSFEDVDASFSRENSYEDKRSYKSHKSHRFPKSSRGRPSASHGFDYESSKPESYRDDSEHHYHSDWLPLSSELVYRFSSHEDFGKDRRKHKDRRHRKDYIEAMKPPPIEITTTYPFHMDTTSIFPQLNPFANWNYNQKLFQSTVPLIGTIEHPNMQVDDRLKNHRNSYEDVGQSLSTLINVPDDSEAVGSKEESKVAFRTRLPDQTTTSTTVRPSRSRGRGNYRGNKKQ